MGKKVYAIKKTMFDSDGKKSHVFINNNHSEVFETSNKDKAINITEILQTNSDSGWFYEVIVIGKNV